MAIQIKQDAPRILADTEGDKRFFSQDGSVIKNLTELTNYFNHIREEVYCYHVNSEKNDFSNWVRDVFGDKKLATELYPVKSPLEAGKILMDKIAWLQKNRSQSRRPNNRA